MKNRKKIRHELPEPIFFKSERELQYEDNRRNFEETLHAVLRRGPGNADMRASLTPGWGGYW